MSRRMKQTFSVVVALCLVAVVTGCGPEEEVAAGDVDQPSPTGGNTRVQGALMTAPSRAPRTIAAHDVRHRQRPAQHDQLTNLIGGPGTSQRHMFQEISYGIQDLQPTSSAPTRCPSTTA